MKHRKPHIKPKLSPAQKEAIYALPLGKQFRIVHIDAGSGFAVFQHVLVDTEANDYAQVLAVAKAYARETPCAINPEVDRRALAARKRLFPGLPVTKNRSNPDLTTEKYGYIDVKSPLNKGNIIRNANNACQQNAIAVITDFMLKEQLKHKDIIQLTEKIFSTQNIDHQENPNYTQDQVHWFVKGTLLKYNRSKKNESFPT
ncbi:MAG: hypothetical protein NC396_07900 [Bacteroides sp.]|nr:hypothetical protein [Bacteroides sp.]MCM1086473.1 hypothetical protein [Bacteroides sp.]